MAKNQSVLLFILVLAIVIVSGCTGMVKQLPDKPLITNITPDKSFGIEGDTINVAVSVTNPIKINYVGQILIQADTINSPNCFGMDFVNIGTQQNIQNVRGYLAPISVLAGASNSVLFTMHIPISNQATCYQPANHKLSVFLLQNGQVLDSKIIDYSLFQKK